jgi:hypothetical protein
MNEKDWYDFLKANLLIHCKNGESELAFIDECISKGVILQGNDRIRSPDKEIYYGLNKETKQLKWFYYIEFDWESDIAEYERK